MHFEGVDSKNSIKICGAEFLAKKTSFMWVPQKVTEIESLSDFDQIWYMEVFEGVDFKNEANVTWNALLIVWWALNQSDCSESWLIFSL